MRRFLRGCVWPLACVCAVLVAGCGPDNETTANLKGEAPKGGLDALKSSAKGGPEGIGKNYPGAAKAQAVAKSAAAKEGATAPAPAK